MDLTTSTWFVGGSVAHGIYQSNKLCPRMNRTLDVSRGGCILKPDRALVLTMVSLHKRSTELAILTMDYMVHESYLKRPHRGTIRLCVLGGEEVCGSVSNPDLLLKSFKSRNPKS